MENSPLPEGTRVKLTNNVISIGKNVQEKYKNEKAEIIKLRHEFDEPMEYANGRYKAIYDYTVRFDDGRSYQLLSFEIMIAKKSWDKISKNYEI